MNCIKALLIGSGYMATEYAKVLNYLGIQFKVAARNFEKLKEFSISQKAHSYLLIDQLNENDIADVNFAIIAVSVENLYEVTKFILSKKCPFILLEKPATLSSKESYNLNNLAIENNCEIKIAYNRRFYQSIITLKDILKTEVPLCANFEFTEWAHTINLNQNQNVLSKWAISNSSHVFDTIRYLLGDFNQINSLVLHKNKLNWHQTSSTFVGSGYCGNVPVSYATSWLSPGRWGIEIMTQNARYKLSPMEKLQKLNHKTVNWLECELDYSMDLNFKPGLLKMVKNFIHKYVEKNTKNLDGDLPSLIENGALLSSIELMAGYETN